MIVETKIAAAVRCSCSNKEREHAGCIRVGKCRLAAGRCRDLRAFSLVEVMAAAFVTAIIFSVLFTGISTTFKLMDTTRENLRGTQIAVSRIEELRLCAWSSSQLFNSSVVPATFTDSFYPLGLKGSTNTGTEYYGTINVTTNCTLSPSSTYADRLALVTVNVYWTNYNGSTPLPHHCSMNTLIAKYGMQNYIFSN